MSYGATDNVFPQRQSNGRGRTATTIIVDEAKGQDSIKPIIASLGIGIFCFSVGLAVLELGWPLDWPTDAIGRAFIVFGGFIFLFGLVILHFRDYRNVISRLRNKALLRQRNRRKRGNVYEDDRDTPTLTHFISQRSPTRIHFEDQADAPTTSGRSAGKSGSNGAKAMRRPPPPIRSVSVASSLYSSADSEILELVDAADECMFDCLMPGSSCCGWLTRFHAADRASNYNVTSSSRQRCDCVEV